SSSLYWGSLSKNAPGASIQNIHWPSNNTPMGDFSHTCFIEETWDLSKPHWLETGILMLHENNIDYPDLSDHSWTFR
ncbi:hypothetical protein HAX54_028818, partial [Datura stramonium]|nr:hypothetical protein [Datura stramonium]